MHSVSWLRLKALGDLTGPAPSGTHIPELKKTDPLSRYPASRSPSERMAADKAKKQNINKPANKKKSPDPLAFLDRLVIAYEDLGNQIDDSVYLKESSEGKEWRRIVSTRLTRLANDKKDLRMQYERFKKSEVIIDSRETSREVRLEVNKLEKLRKKDLMALLTDPLLLRKQRDIGQEADEKLKKILRDVYTSSKKGVDALAGRYKTAVEAAEDRSQVE